MDEVSDVIYFPLCATEEDPIPPLHIPYPLGCMLKNFKRGFNGDYGVKLTPGKFRTFFFF
jgi:hypothetical protein